MHTPSSKVLPKQVGCPSNRPVLKAYTFLFYPQKNMLHHFSRLALTDGWSH